MSHVELMPVSVDGRGNATYRATVYTDNNGRIALQATVSAPLRGRMAQLAKRGAAWAAEHVRMPHGGLADLMAGQPPACGCDALGDTFRAAAMRVADTCAEVQELDAGAEVDLAWSFDEWDDAPEQFLPDVEAATWDAIGATVARRGTLSRLPVSRRVRPGVAQLATMFAGALGHA